MCSNESIGMKQSSLFFPVSLIIIGALWFLRSSGILPTTTSLVAIVLMGAGGLVLLLDGFNKQSLFYAPMLFYAGIASYLCSAYRLAVPSLIALGMVLAGCLMLIVRSPGIPPKQSKKYPPKPHDQP